MKVRFLVTRTVQAVDGETYEAGQVYDLPDASAQRWKDRGVAVDDDGTGPVATAAQKPATGKRKVRGGAGA